MSLGHSWAQTQAMVSSVRGPRVNTWSLHNVMFQFHDMGIGDGMSPRIHPKSMDTLLEQHQAEILEDLNSLGRYSRSVSHRGTRVIQGRETHGDTRETVYVFLPGLFPIQFRLKSYKVERHKGDRYK